MEFVQLRTYDTYIPASLVLQRLEAEGIRAYLQDEFTVTADPILTNAIGGIKLMVFAAQANRARDLLGEYEKSYRESARCPSCFSHNISFLPSSSASNRFTAILTWLFGNYAISAEKEYCCADCGFRFENPDYPFQSED